MKIRIKSKGCNLTFWLPTRLILNKTTVRLANSVGRKYAADAMKDISPKALDALVGELCRIKKVYGKWDLVHIESSDGSIVKINL